VWLVEIFIAGSVNFVFFLQEWRFSRSRSSKVIDFGASRQRACDFLLVRHNNLGPILHRFRDMARFYAPNPTPIPSQFWGCSRRTRPSMLGS